MKKSSNIFRIGLLGIIGAGILALYLMPGHLVKAREFAPATPAPAFTHNNKEAWINSPPLTLEQLRGQVVMLDFWAYDCWNCYRSFPWLKELESRYHDQGFIVVGVHTPEFEREKVRANVVEKVKEFGLPHPVMMDNDFSYWNAVGNRYWPTFYLIDKKGNLRAQFIGETHAGDSRARKIEAAVKTLLAEPAS